MATGTIVGIVIAVLAFLALLAVCAVIFRRRRHKKQPGVYDLGDDNNFRREMMVRSPPNVADDDATATHSINLGALNTGGGREYKDSGPEYVDSRSGHSQAFDDTYIRDEPSTSGASSPTTSGIITYPPSQSHGFQQHPSFHFPDPAIAETASISQSSYTLSPGPMPIPRSKNNPFRTLVDVS